MGAETAAKFWLPFGAVVGTITGAVVSIETGDASLFMPQLVIGLLLGAVAFLLTAIVVGLVMGVILGARTARTRWPWARKL